MVTSDTKRLPASPVRHIAGLDAIRVLACLLVVAVHAGLSEWCAENNPGGIPTHAFDGFRPYVSFGWIGVQIFFVLSGFVIAYSASEAKPGAFLLSRVSRLLPALALCATFTGATLLFFHEMAVPEVLRRWRNSVTFLPQVERMDGSYWTLTLEMSFYLLVFCTLAMGRRHRLERVIGVLGLASSAVTLSIFFLHRLGPSVTRITLAPFQKLPFNQFLFVRYGCFFSLGVFLWLVLLRGITPARLLVLTACFAGGLAEIAVHARELGPQLGNFDLSRTASVVWTASLVAIVFSTRWNLPLQRALGPRGVLILRQLGLMTYPLYLLHQAFGKVAVVHLLPYTGPATAMALTLAGIFLLSYGVGIYVEPPLQRRFRSTVSLLASTRFPAALLAPAHFAYRKAIGTTLLWKDTARKSSSTGFLAD